MNDLINLPSTGTGQKMLKSVSPIYDRSYVGKWLFEVMGLEMHEARQYVDEFRLQAYPETATWGLKYWEQRYHLKTDETLPIEERRQRVLSKRWQYAPMNPVRLAEYVSRLSGMTAVVAEHNDEYRFEVEITSESGKMNYGNAIQLIKKAKPSHIAFDISLKFMAQNQRQFGGGITCTDIIALTTS